MKRLIVVTACSSMLLACKGDAVSSVAVKDSCARVARLGTEIRKDIESAEREAVIIDEAPVPANDEAATIAGELAQERCMGMALTIAHARGLAWAVDDELKGLDPSRTRQPFDDTDWLRAAAKATAACRGDSSRKAPPMSPAQMKASVTPEVHKLNATVFGRLPPACSATSKR
jgi:hypothetical protein